MIAGWLRERLWRANDWCAELASLKKDRNRSPERMFDLGVASEHCDPDRGNALALFLDAARSGYAPAADRARALAMALGAHTTLAELASSAGDLLGAGTAYLDAGFPELAVEPLQRFIEQRPPGASVSSEHLRLERVTPLLALARRAKLDVETHLAGCLSTATVPAFLHAERLARLSSLEDRRASVINAARLAFPDDPYVSAIVAARLFERSNGDELLAYYADTFERSPSRAHYVARVCAAGVELIARNVQPGAGLRLLRMGLEQAYAGSLPGVTSHLAAWQLIWSYAKQQSSTAELVPLIVQAFTAPLPEDDAVFLARLGLEIVWRDARDPLAAQPYAAIVLDFVPDQPLAVAFVEEVMPPELIEPPERVGLEPNVPEPGVPEPGSGPEPQYREPAPLTVSFSTRVPVIKPEPAALVPPTPPPPEQLAKATSRIAVIEQGQVKRAVTPPAPHKATSRMDLLRAPPRTIKPATVPPPRAAALKRDTSPIPMKRAPLPAPIDRAERKVVPVDVVVELPSGSFFSTVLRDVSTSGAFIVTKRTIDPGKLVTLELRLPEPGKLTQTASHVQARIARCTELGWGVAFVDASRELVAALRIATG